MVRLRAALPLLVRSGLLWCAEQTPITTPQLPPIQVRRWGVGKRGERDRIPVRIGELHFTTRGRVTRRLPAGT